MLEKTAKPRKKRRFRFAVIVLILGIVTFFGVMAYGSVHVVKGVKRTAESLEVSAQHASRFAFTDVRQELFIADAGLDQALFGMKWLQILKPIPLIGDQIRGITYFLEAGKEGIGIFSDMSIIAEDFQKELEREEDLDALFLSESGAKGFSGLREDVRIRLIYRLRQSAQEIESIRLRLKLISQSMEKTQNLSLMAPLKTGREYFIEPLRDFQEIFSLLTPISKVAHQLFGAREAKQWLILYTNNNEIRPAGGFLGVYGLALMKAGVIEAMTVEDTYALDRLAETAPSRPKAPEAITRYTGVKNWYLRDANWSPDFFTSAKTSAQLLREESSIASRPVPHIDHVIGFTPQFISEVLSITGPITVHGITYTSENIASVLQEEVEFGFEDRGDSFQERKRLIGLMTEELMKKVFALPVTKWPEFARMIVAEFKEKQLFIASFDEEVQNVFVSSGFAGSFFAKQGDDALLVVDANMVANKTDLAVNRAVLYEIEKTTNGYRATVTIRYQHESEKTLLISDYRTFTRIFVPKGSVLVDVQGATDSFIETIEDDLGFTSFGAFLRVPVKEERELRFVYDLPRAIVDSVNNGVYQLSVLRQLGSQEIPVAVKLDFDRAIRSALPSEEKRFYGDKAYQFETILIHDTVFTVQF